MCALRLLSILISILHYIKHIPIVFQKLHITNIQDKLGIKITVTSNKYISN